MKILKFLSIAILCFAFGTSVVTAQGQSRTNQDTYTFIGVQYGGQVTFTDCSFNDLATPVGAVSVGSYLTPAMGFRFNVQGWNGKSGIDDMTFDYKYVTGNFDLLLNLSNTFFPKNRHFFNVILLGGFGMAYAWDCDGYENTYGIRNMYYRDRSIVHNLRVGMQLECNISKHFALNLEVQANNLGDKFNFKKSGSYDWQSAALIGITYKFGINKRNYSYLSGVLANSNYNDARFGQAANANMPTVKEKKAEEQAVAPKQEKPAVVVAPKKEDVAVRTKETLKKEVFFTINSVNIAQTEEGKIKELATWLNEHPTANVELTGYADAATGTSAYNMNISFKRVESVAEMLKKYGVDSKRIVTAYKGDTAQPFKENDKNRVTICVATEK